MAKSGGKHLNFLEFLSFFLEKDSYGWSDILQVDRGWVCVVPIF